MEHRSPPRPRSPSGAAGSRSRRRRSTGPKTTVRTSTHPRATPWCVSTAPIPAPARWHVRCS